MTVKLSLLYAIGFGRYNRLNLALRKVLQYMIGVIAFVGQYGIGFKPFYQCLRMRHITDLSTTEQTAQRVAQRIDRRMDFGAQPAPGASEGLIACFFWAPAACWWALTTVLSIMSASKSRSAPRTLMMPSHLPRLHQRLKRVYVLCQLPSSAGRSRQGEPVRAIHSTASINRRLSAAVTPLSLALPGNIASIFAHLLSLRSPLAILPMCSYAPQIIASNC
jgi:hypothetical protein